MGILKILETKNEQYHSEDSFSMPPQLTTNHSVPKKEPFLNSKKLIMTLILTLGGVGITGFWLSIPKKPSAQTFVFFEIKAIGTAGHPVAGAKVYYKGKRIGTTDSFGEWRKYMKALPGNTVRLTIKKKSQKHTLAATKNYAIPTQLTKKEGVQIGGPIRLLTIESQRHLSTDTDNNRLENNDRKISRQTGWSGHTKEQMQSMAGNIWFQILRSKGDDTSQRKGIELLKKYVLPPLKTKAEKNKYTLSPHSPKKILLQHIRGPKGSNFQGLIRVTINTNNKHPISFLQNYTGQGKLTASSIFHTLQRYKNIHHPMKSPPPRRTGKNIG